MSKASKKILQAGNENKPEQLKTCPFCGADKETGVHIDTIVYNDDIGDDIERYAVICENCGVSTWEFKSIEQAVQAWNRRNVKHGVWLHCHDHNECLECSECDYVVECNEKSNYCPACGAKMDKKEMSK